MIIGGVGGGNTVSGLKFERKRSILEVFKKMDGYQVKNENTILYQGKEVAMSYKKHALYKFLKSKDIDYKKYLSKQLLPDEALFVIVNHTLFVIEMKFQKTEGSVDEKLQTCDFKKKQYTKLMSPLKMKVEYIYILSDWFKHPKYKDSLDYIESVGCHYFFEFLPLKELGLPIPL